MLNLCEDGEAQAVTGARLHDEDRGTQASGIG